MKLKQLFLLLSFVLFSVGAMAQSGTEKISLSFKDIPLKEAMERIEKASGYTFFYDATQINVEQRVSLAAQKEELRLALRKMLNPTNVAFRFSKKQIVLTLKEAQNQKKGPAKDITGVVTDQSGEPIIGATVMVKGTVNGVLTDLDGKYLIKAREGETLEFRYIGYNSQEQKVKDKTIVNVAMAESNVNLDDVVVIGYGSQKKESVVSSVNSIKPAGVAIPTRSLSNAIAGQVAGVISIQTSGEPGSDDASFWIRGQSSYAGGTSPLVLVDGVPRSMNDLDTDEIESFTVLKDAAATAVYGSEGANGVVLITTKRGRAQKTVVSFNAQYSIATPTRMPELMDSWDYLAMYNEAAWNDAGNPDWDTFMQNDAPYSAETLELYRSGADPDLYPNAIWTDLLSKHTQNQRYTVNFRGGSDKTKFFVSGAYYSESGIFNSNPLEDYNANINLKRYNLRSNVDMDITPTTKLSIDMSGQYKTKNSPGTGTSESLFENMVRFPTHLIPMVYSDGSASAVAGETTGRYNPYSVLNYSGYSKNWAASLQSKVTLKQKLDFITKGLSVQGSISFDATFSSTMKRTMEPEKWQAKGRDEEGNLIKELISSKTPLTDPTYSASSGTKKVYIEAQLNYNRTFAKVHEVSGVLVYNQKETQYQNVSGISLLPHRKQNVVMRGTYAYDGRYVLEASFGATGSENFAAGHRWGIFPAVGGAWNVHAEKFMQEEKVMDIVSKLRLRASYGITGNDNTGSNRFVYREELENLSTSSYPSYLGLTGEGGTKTNNFGRLYEGTFAVPDLTWEIEKKINVGIDLGLFRGRVDITADYFSNRRENILIERVTIPTATGFRENPWQNFGVTTNKGFDASVVLKQNIGDWKLSARGNITYAVNKRVEQDEVPQKYPWLAQTGTSIGTNKIYVAEGLFMEDDFIITTNSDGSHSYQLKPGIATYTDEVRPGDIKYKDLNGDGTINDNDKTYYSGVYPNNPQVVYGFGLNAQYKGFYAGVFFQGAARRSVNLKYSNNYFVPFYGGTDQTSARVEAADHWRADNPGNTDVLYPRLHKTNFSNNTLESTWWYRSGNYLRLKNVEFGYQFDKKLIQKLKMQNLRLYIQGSNLAVFDKIKMWDPEVGNSGARYPINATWTFGLDVTF